MKKITDKERLDFLTKRGSTTRSTGPLYWGLTWTDLKMTLDPRPTAWGGHGRTPRQAIDAAIRSSRRASKKGGK